MVINMCEYNNVPKIRFKGFTDVWEQRKFGDYGTVSMCKRIFKNETSDSGDIPFYKIGTFGGKADAFISNDKYEYYKSKFSYPNKGDILLSASGTIGRIVEYTGEKAYFQDSNIVWLNHNEDIKNVFLKVLYPTVKWDGIEGSTIKRLYNSNFLNTCINIPNTLEQDKIGELFANLDNLITLHQRKCDTLVNAKKSLLEKMFPKNSSNIPEIRFKEFTDVWEQRKLEEISNRFDNLRVPVSANEREKGTTPYYGANGIQDYVKGFTHNGEYVLIAEDGANDLKNYPVKYVNGLFWANNHVHVVQGKEGICDNKYLKYCFTKTNIESLLVGGGRAKLNANIMMGIELTVPSFKEQVELGRMFYELDNLITLHQRKLEKLKNIKKSMLDKMFV